MTKRMTKRAAAAAAYSDPERLMSLKVLGEYLDVPIQTLYQWRRHRRGPIGMHVGGRVRYRKADVDQWLETQRDRREP